MTTRIVATGALRSALGLLSAVALTVAACDGGRLDAADWPDTPPNYVSPDSGGADATADVATDTSADATTDGVLSDLADTTPDMIAPDAQPDADAQAEVDVPTVCTPTREYWETEVWDSFMGSQCVNCHVSGGIGAGTQLVLDTAGTTAALDGNYDVSVAVAMLTSGPNRLLTDKPTNQLPHGGGPQLTAGSAQHLALIEFVDRVLNPVSCDPQN